MQGGGVEAMPHAAFDHLPLLHLQKLRADLRQWKGVECGGWGLGFSRGGYLAQEGGDQEAGGRQ